MIADVSRETLERLREYERLVGEWSRRINLVSASTLGSFWERHILDSLQVSGLAQADDEWCDLGSGGGLPGLVVSIARPNVKMTLIESDNRKCVFLRHAARQLDLKVQVTNDRIERADPAGADIVSARAVAPLDRLIRLAQRHGAPIARYVFPKGARYREEIAAAQKNWSFDVDVLASRVDKSGVILKLENIARV